MATDGASPGTTGIAALDRRPLWNGGRDFGLETPRKLLEALGNPQDAVPSIHVGGTNGKGSVCAFLAAIMRQQGGSVGQFTSPHLSHVTERCLVNGLAVRVAELTRSVDEVIVAAESCGLDPSFFELISAASYLEFRRRDLDHMVIEVGLGGRLDATNLMRCPKATVITNVQHDHMHILGDTLALIAGEKAGILRQGVPLITGPLEPDAFEVISKRARQLEVPLISYGRDYWVDDADSSVRFANTEPLSIAQSLPLAGRHQLDNAAVAVCVARQLDVADAEIVQGLSRARWPGRLEWVESARTNGSKVLLDVGHNEDGIASILSYLRSYAHSSSAQKIAVVCSILDRKEWREMLDLLREGFGVIATETAASIEFVFTASGHNSAVEPQQMREYFGQGKVVCDPSEALDSACSSSGRDGFTVVLGSAYLVGDIRPMLVDSPFQTIV